MKIANLQVNHMENPCGIDGNDIVIRWKLEDGKKQTAYEVVISDISDTDRKKEIEATGKIVGGQMFYHLKHAISYRTKAEIILRVWDESDIVSDKSHILVTTGIEKKAWKAKWIDPEKDHTPKERQRASYLKKTFMLTEEDIEAGQKKGAFLYVTCHGLMNIKINGREITDHQLMPGTQQYDKRLMVETISVEAFLKTGENEIVVALGDGWYRGSMGMSQEKNVYGDDVALLAQLEIARKSVCLTDETWHATQNGPIGLNDFMAGEEYDAQLEELCDLHDVKVKDFGYENLICRDTVPIVPKETFPATWLENPKGEKILDFGQNVVGYVMLDFEGCAGKKITLTHGEVLDANGNFTIANFQNPKMPVKQEVHYICKDGHNTYHPTMTYMGFRYVKVEADFDIDASAFTAVAIYSDMRQTGQFGCGVEEINQLFKNALWSMKGNFVDVPTDCPTREKSGYSGDCQAYIHTAMYLMDCYPVYAKWFREQAAGQYDDGVVPQIAPKCSKAGKKEKLMGKIEIDGGIGWSDSFEIVSFRLMQRYGDDALIRDNYDALKKWTEYEINRAKETRLVNKVSLPKKHRQYMIDTGWMWGEWLEPNQDSVSYMKNLIIKGDPEVGTAFFYLHLVYMSKMADHLGKKEDAAHYQEIAEKAKEAYRAVYLENGRVKEEKRQCRFVRPIAHNLLFEEEKKQAAADLADKITKNGDHLNTGFLTTHELCRSLSRYGQKEKAYDLLLQKEMPGWLYAVTKGCTTIPEDWDCFDKNGNPKDSFNHYSYGAIVGWLMDSVCGIVVEDGAITVAPQPDARLGYANATYDSPYGLIMSAWKYEKDRIVYTFEIPSNMTATIRLEGCNPEIVDPGFYERIVYL